MTFFRALLLYVFVSLACLGRGQSGMQPRFEQLPLDMGLTHSSVNCVLQDSRGYIWFGTWSGLIRYDGYGIRIFRHESNNPEGLRADPITSLLEDRQGRLWVGTLNGGLHRYDRASGRFEHFAFDPANSNGISDNNVWCIFQDTQGDIWVGTKRGLNRYEEKNRRWTQYFAPAQTGSYHLSDHINDICETADRSIWAATALGLCRLLPAPDGAYALQWHPLQEADHAAQNAADNFCYRIKPCVRETDALWLATKGGLKKLHYQPGIPAPPAVTSFRHEPDDPGSLSHNQVEDVLESPNGDVWVATLNGLNLLENGSRTFRRFFARPDQGHALSSNSIHALMQDRSGILWIGTEKGLNKMNPQAQPFVSLRFDKTDHSANNIVSGICSAPDGFWVGTYGGGLHRVLDGGGLRHYTLAPSRFAHFAHFISGIARDPSGGLWISTKGAGLLHLRENDMPASGGTITRIRQFSMDNSGTGLNDDHVMSVFLQHEPAAGPQPLVWLGNWDGGIDLWDANTGIMRHFQTCGALSLTAFPNIAFAETQAPNGRRFLWVGTRGNGLLQLSYDLSAQKLELVRHFKHKNEEKNALPDDKINCLYTDRQGRLWIGTGAGLSVFTEKTALFKTWTQADGLPFDDVQSVIEDASGQLWAGTQNGLASLRELSDGALAIRRFDALDGLQDNYFYINAAARNSDGALAFGGAEGLSLFDPAGIRLDTVAPQTAVSQILLFNRPVYADPGFSALQLSYRDNVLTFELASLHFAEPKKNKFAYKLEGFDPDWIYADADKRFAHYTNLPYKNFVFRAKSCNAAGVWSEEITIPVTVSPPFWRSAWACGLYLLLFAALLYGVWRITHLRAGYRNRLALERIEREKMEELNRMKLQFFTNISHELRTPLTLIASPLEQLLREKAGDKPLHAALTRMYQNTGRLLSLIGQLLDFRKSEAGLMPLQAENTNLRVFVQDIVFSFKNLASEQHIELTISAEKPDIHVWIDRDQMEKVLFNLLSNALKYTPPGGGIRVELCDNTGDNNVEIRVHDTGPGIPEAYVEKVFDPFYQTGQPASRRLFGSTGIGLALVKSIVETHGGSVRAANTAGQGATFALSIPLGHSHFKPEQLMPARPPAPLPETPVLQDNLSGEAAPRPAAEQPIDAAETRPRLQVLVVDDHADIRNYLRESLQDEYDITEAADGREALEKARQLGPDLVLSDVAMPEMDGIEMCRLLKADLRTSHIPVVLLTARNTLGYQVQGLETGADDYLAKPFNLQVLQLRIRNLIQSRALLREKFSRTPELGPAEVTPNPVDAAFLRQVIELVEQHLDDNRFSIDDLAQRMAISRIQLYRKLKALSGDSPNNFIRTIRLKHAAQLLASGQCNVSEAAYKTGFSDLKYFRERFREQFGVNPGVYTGGR